MQEPRGTDAPAGRLTINRSQTSTSAQQQNGPDLSAAQAVILKIQPNPEHCKFVLQIGRAGTQPPCPLKGPEHGLRTKTKCGQGEG